MELDDFLRWLALRFWAPMSPLFEVEWDAMPLALVPQRADPVGMGWSRFTTTLTAGDDPVDLLVLEPSC
jgi:hypothetical protein